MTVKVRRPTTGASGAHDLATRIRRDRKRRGFTLVELVVASTAGLLVAGAAFLLARNASSFFQKEANVTAAQFSSIMGMARLQTDIRRASFLSTSNPEADPRLCGDTTTWPAGMRELGGIRITEGGSVVAHGADHPLSGANGLNPDSVVVSGAFDTTEQFAVESITVGAGGGLDVFLQNDGAMTRTAGAAAGSGVDVLTVFSTGRFLRIADEEGRIGFGVVTAVDTTGDYVRVSVSANPLLPRNETAGVCGCAGQCRGALVNPFFRVRYDLRAIDPNTYPQYNGLYAQSTHNSVGQHKGASATPLPRTELVRVELDADGNEIPESLELIAEHAVDLKFGLTAQTAQGPAPALAPVHTRYDVGDPNVYTAAGAVIGGARPERIRSIHVRLSTRGARRDRDTGLPASPNDGGLLRYSLGAGLGFARMRTLNVDAALLNQTRGF